MRSTYRHQERSNRHFRLHEKRSERCWRRTGNWRRASGKNSGPTSPKSGVKIRKTGFLPQGDYIDQNLSFRDEI
jgi:hypothetical protein